MMDDLILWRQLKTGDRSALEKIYRLHAKDLLRYGRKFAVTEQTAEDALQDLIIELWRNRESLGDTDSIRRYLLVALRRKIIRLVKKQSKFQSEASINEAYFQAELSIDEVLMQAELSAEQSVGLKKAMENLSKRQKEAIYLKYFMEMDYEEIGEVMDINYQSVRNVVFTALKSLRKHFQVWWWMILQLF